MMARGEHPNSLANLKKGKRFVKNDERTAKCGRKSQEVQRKKRAMQDIALQILHTQVPMDDDAKDNLCKSLGLEADDLTFEMMAVIAQVKKAAGGDLPALAFLRDTIGEKPKENVNITNLPVVISGEDNLED